ncbi:MAG TPA: TIR domain-containing protein, partial [Verrucomicrobiae bacterium]|nr:TIR domain-containing protein [Verrucomicrobiae bacterium]
SAIVIARYAWTHSPTQIEALVRQLSISDSKAKNELSGTIKWLLGSGWLGGSAALLIAAWAHVRKVAGNALHVELAKYLASPDYEGHVSFIDTFHTDFQNMLAAYAGNKRVYVFIDDLDRCDVPKAAELMQAINLMIGDDPRLVFILGMDREKVAAGIAQKYKDLISFLPDFAKTSAGVNPIEGLYFGYSYLEKFIQLTFRIPGLDGDAAINKYLDSLAEIKLIKPKKQLWKNLLSSTQLLLKPADTRALESGPSTQKQSDQPEKELTTSPKEDIDWQRIETRGDSDRIRRIVSMVSPLFQNNPRRLKQFLNSFRLTLYLASAQGLLDRKGQKSAATHEQLGKFVALMMRCPDLLSLLQKNQKLFEKLYVNEFKDDESTPTWIRQQGVKHVWNYGIDPNSTPYDVNTYSLELLDVSKLLSIMPLAPPPPTKSFSQQPQTESSHPNNPVMEHANNQSMATDPSDKFDVYLSYRSEDRSIAGEIVRALQDSDLEVFWDQEVSPETKTAAVIADSIETSDVIVFCLSKSELSKMQQMEITSALQLKEWRQDTMLVPILLPGMDSNNIPTDLKQFQWLDYRKRNVDSLTNLVEAIKQRHQRGAGSVAL